MGEVLGVEAVLEDGDEGGSVVLREEVIVAIVRGRLGLEEEYGGFRRHCGAGESRTGGGNDIMYRSAGRTRWVSARNYYYVQLTIDHTRKSTGLRMAYVHIKKHRLLVVQHMHVLLLLALLTLGGRGKIIVR